MTTPILAVIAGSFDDVSFASFGLDVVAHVKDFTSLELALDVNQPDVAVIDAELAGFISANQSAGLRLLSPTTYLLIDAGDASEAEAAEFGGAHLSSVRTDRASLASQIARMIESAQRDRHRSFTDRRSGRTDLDATPETERRGVDWGPAQAVFNAQT